MTIAVAGQPITLLAQWYDYAGGPPADVAGVTITIRRVSDSAVVVGPTSAGVGHPATGVYTYTWPVPAAQPIGDYLVVWSGTDPQSDAVTATELVTVAGSDGVTYPLTRLTTTVSSGGTPVDPATVTVTVLQPDGTTLGPFTGVRDSAGTYHYDYTPAMAGRHIARWVTTTPSGMDEEPFEVFATWSEAGIISLAEAKAQLNIASTDTTDDEEISGFIRSVTAICERYAGAIVRRTHVEKHRGGYGIALAWAPVLSLTSVAAVETGGVDQEVADLDLDGPTGIVQRKDGRYMRGPFRVSYVAGRTEVPPDIRQAALIILQHVWDTQRGQMGTVRGRSSEEPWDPRKGFSIPRRALELLGDPMPLVG
ncbi:phage gp6-like head-tail connector protein [Planotetraspora sp. A-T 1434]|uniref:head-tail connector protein n=1 Tax=Planotetraspora sp. A-T 1434 TaxID=2979219 RepID=UPI0021C15D5D|nr:head-tail connector protein [Planotetraspora sp. A-T 1434]MCT9932448.1 phage gp6-like head-tail connector protein [Planotetraspora sp. A-T 1434]